MKALILAAGLGSRLKHKTTDRPKTLTLINGKPILEYQLTALEENGIKDVILVLGYLGNMVVDFVSTHFPHLNVQYFWNDQYEKTSSAYSFWQARHLICDSPYVHLNCDNLFSKTLLQKIINSPHENVIAVRRDIELGEKMENVELLGDKIKKMTFFKTPNACGKAFGVAKLGVASTHYLTKLIESNLSKKIKNMNYYGMIREAVGKIDYRALVAEEDLLLEINTLEDHHKAEQTLKNMSVKNLL